MDEVIVKKRTLFDRLLLPIGLLIFCVVAITLWLQSRQTTYTVKAAEGYYSLGIDHTRNLVQRPINKRFMPRPSYWAMMSAFPQYISVSPDGSHVAFVDNTNFVESGINISIQSGLAEKHSRRFEKYNYASLSTSNGAKRTAVLMGLLPTSSSSVGSTELVLLDQNAEVINSVTITKLIPPMYGVVISPDGSEIIVTGAGVDPDRYSGKDLSHIGSFAIPAGYTVIGYPEKGKLLLFDEMKTVDENAPLKIFEFDINSSKLTLLNEFRLEGWTVMATSMYASPSSDVLTNRNPALCFGSSRQGLRSIFGGGDYNLLIYERKTQELKLLGNAQFMNDQVLTSHRVSWLPLEQNQPVEQYP